MAWVEEIKRNGKISYRYCDRVEINGKTKRVVVSMAKDTKKERDRAVLELREKCERLEHPERQRDMYELLDLYLDKIDCRESSRKNIRSEVRVILRVLEGVPLDVTAINRALLESEIKPKTLKGYICRYKTFLKWLCKYGYAPMDFAPFIPLISVDYKKEKKPEEEMYLELDELEKVLNQLTGMYHYIVKFLALTGCRIGECAALRLDDVDELPTSDKDKRYIHITKTESNFGITPPKTRAGNRDVYIQPELAEMLKEYKEWRLLYCMSRGIRTDRLFFTMHGNRIMRDGMCRALGRVERDLPELGKHLHAHMFRHTHVALMAEAGMSLEAIARRVGHERSDITHDIYYHVTKKQKEKDEEVVKGIRIFNAV